MITDKDVIQLFRKFKDSLMECWDDDQFSEISSSQFWRGSFLATEKFNYCMRNHLVFDSYKIIPKSCFKCYKIQVTPRNVVELLKLMVIFERLHLPNDNTRKCMVEARPNITGAYKGLIYSKSLKESQTILKKVRKVVSEEISPEIRVALKRGCSEFSLVYPEFERLNKTMKPVMRYKEQWYKIEEFAENYIPEQKYKMPGIDYNKKGFDFADAAVMLSWLKYAATIGDLSYSKITELQVPKFKDLNRPPYSNEESKKQYPD